MAYKACVRIPGAFSLGGKENKQREQAKKGKGKPEQLANMLKAS